MPPKQQSLLLDANVIIEAHRQEVWQVLVERWRVVVPATVVRLEAHFFVSPRDGRKYVIDLPSMVARDEIVEWEGSAAQIRLVLERFKPGFSQSIDEGEAEALACMLSGDEPDAAFVTGDGPAIRAAAMLGMPDKVTCLASILRHCGHGRALPSQHSDAFFGRELTEGNRRFVTREDLV